MREPLSMRIRRWHWGKIVILWAWGGIVVAMLLARFLSQKADVDPGSSLLSFIGSILILGGLTAVTWVWLGGKEEPPADVP